MNDPGFWWEFVGKLGAPIFAATLVACLLSGAFAPLHGVLMGTGLAMMGASHWHDHHRGRHGTGPDGRSGPGGAAPRRE